MAVIITGKKNVKFLDLVRYIMSNLHQFKDQYIEGIPKLRLIKLLLIELAELKKVNFTHFLTKIFPTKYCFG